MDDVEKTVELMSSSPTKEERWIDRIYNVPSDTYYVPDPRSLPAPFQTPDGVSYTGKGIVVAFIDSGVMTNHPIIRRSLIAAIDFTGEGVEDTNGHGTMVTLIQLCSMPDTKIISVKVIDGEGRGRESHLRDGLAWCGQQQEAFDIDSINLSAGVFHKKWGFWDCKGDCQVCQAAAFGSSKNIVIVAAAGNNGPGQTPCPQKLGMRGGITTVGALDPQTGHVADYSGRAMFVAKTGYPLVPLPKSSGAQ